MIPDGGIECNHATARGLELRAWSLEEDTRMSSTSERATLTAPDISCGHCVATVERAVGALAGVQTVAADAATKRVTVEFDPNRVTLARIADVLADEGYPVEA